MHADARTIVNDVTRLNPVAVWAVATPTSVEEVQEAVRATSGPISIGGGRFSMGGQIASPGSLHFDLRALNRVLAFSPPERTIASRPGIRWCDIQRFVDPHGPGGQDHAVLRQLHRRRVAQRERARPLHRPGSVGAVGALDQARAADGSLVRRAARQNVRSCSSARSAATAPWASSSRPSSSSPTTGAWSGRTRRCRSSEYWSLVPRHRSQRSQGGLPQRRLVRAATTPACARSPGTRRTARPPSPERLQRPQPRLPAAKLFPLGGLGDAASASGAASDLIDPLLYLRKRGALAQLRGGIRRGRARAAARARPHLRAPGVLRPGRALDEFVPQHGGDPAPPPRQHAQHLHPSRRARPGTC